MFGGLIAGKAFSLCRQQDLIEESFRVPFIATVENACLLHDAGNPPFGHLGEFAIRDWFSKRETRLKRRWSLFMDAADVETHYSGFKHFDGNPQGLRIVSKLQWLKDPFGLNLTCTLLASLLKYLSSAPRKGAPFRKKIGFFETEREAIRDVWKTLGLPIDEYGQPAQRHPLAYLMEAADDIAYCVSDIEDAIEKHVVSQDFFFDNLDSEVKKCLPAERAEWSSRNSTFIEFRVNLTRQLAETAARIYFENHAQILSGTFAVPLLEADDFAQRALDSLKNFAKTHIFSSREAVNIELSGFRIVQGLLEGFRRLFFLPPDHFERLLKGEYGHGQMALEKRLVTLLPDKYHLAYKHHVGQLREGRTIEPALRAHLIVDYIAGMTDSHAVKVFNMLSGISAGTSYE